MNVRKCSLIERAHSVYSKYIVDLPVAIGISGGPDSCVALITLVTFIRSKKYTGDIHAVYIRDATYMYDSDISEWLNCIANDSKNNMTLHVVDSEHFLEESNGKFIGEEHFRDERIKIFKEIYNKYKCKALILGHQAEDRAETVFKRFIEGASILKLYGMNECDDLNGMKIIRPLLSINKKQILNFVKKENIPFKEDASNYSQKHMRGKMRTRIFPCIEKELNKDIVSPICRIADHSKILENHFKNLCKDYIKDIEDLFVNTGVLIIPKSICNKLDLAELIFVIKEVSDFGNKKLSRDVLMNIAHAFFKDVNKKFSCGKLFVHVNSNHGIIFE